MWNWEYIGTCCDRIYTELFNPYDNLYLKYLTNAVTTGPDNFFHNYSHIYLQEYTKVLLLEFVQGQILQSLT